MCEYVKLQEFTSIDELYLYGCIEDDKYVKDIWNDFDFIVLDEYYEYYYETGDSVFIKDQGLYGVVVKIEESDKKIVFYVKLEKHIGGDEEVDDNKWVSCEADQLAYAERPATIKAIKESYSNYIDRITH